MITYEEFIEKNKIENLTSLVIGKNNVRSYMNYKGAIEESPKEYMDIASKAENLKDISIFPIETKDYIDDIKKFVKECREDITISCADIGKANKEEFFEAEKIIDSVVSGIEQTWSVKQKLAYVHYKMGELVTYYPEYNYNNDKSIMSIKSEDLGNNRNIWKMLTSGKGVCNGIVQLERTILARMDVNTKELSSGTHSFLLTEMEDGSNIITDATWDLSYTLFGAKPQFFGLSYEEFLKRDGNLSTAHKLENPPENVKTLSDEEIRDIYQSIGIIKEDKVFNSSFIQAIIKLKSENNITEFEKAKEIFDYIELNEKNKFKHMEECGIIFGWGMRTLGIKPEDFITQYVYDKEDKYSQNPNLVFCIKNEEEAPIIKMINPKNQTIEEMTLDKLENEYNCHIAYRQEPFWKKIIENEKKCSEISLNNEENVK